QGQLTEVRNQLAGTAPIRRRQLTEALAALQEALQEVEVAEEELSQQNEELITAREALEIERHRFQDLFAGAPVGYLVTGLTGVIRQANRAATALLHSAEEALLGKPFAVFLPPAERGGFRALLAEMKDQPAPRERELTLQPHGSPARKVLATVARDVDEKAGKPAGLRWVLQDISERRAAEDALRESQERLRHSQRLEAIGRLAGSVAHSFNNLLAAIAFHSELLLDDRCAKRDIQRHAEEIQHAGERAAALARQLLAFSRKQALNPARLSLGDLIESMEPILRRLLGEDIVLGLDIDPATGLVYADFGQLEQVLLNLIANARDAMPEDGRLTIRTASMELSEENQLRLPPGSYVTLTVTDTGVGMSPEVLARLFEPFFTTKERGQGTGLGLSTVYGIVRQSGGEIQAESAPGAGTTFTIYLPQADAARDEPELPPVESRAPAGSEVVLLVEDEDNIREPATEVLEANGYSVLPARDGAEALQIARRHPGPIHLMITDVMMPHMNGSRLVETLHTLRPETRVLYISGYPEDAVAKHGALVPRHRFLQKPFSPGTFLTTVREVLESTQEQTPERQVEQV
ncbi:MAG TPA: ATP-binding protein, partial [Thermoanaerobaculia bacterium]|nr:ATP-binding protein [Thermoanaerobaculia bacterium]